MRVCGVERTGGENTAKQQLTFKGPKALADAAGFSNEAGDYEARAVEESRGGGLKQRLRERRSAKGETCFANGGARRISRETGTCVARAESGGEMMGRADEPRPFHRPLRVGEANARAVTQSLGSLSTQLEVWSIVEGRHLGALIRQTRLLESDKKEKPADAQTIPLLTVDIFL